MKRALILCLTILSVLLIAVSISAEEKKASGQLEEIVVSGTRESEPLKETPKTINVITSDVIKEVKPAIPSDILNREPGVWVNQTAGEGHLTSIRQPLNSNPVYLYLEDGIPIRSTGFFNHNALYEMDLPLADRIEIMKGPATALYGSDAIGGTINVLTKPSPEHPELYLNPEVGLYGWYRMLATGGNTWGANGIRTDLNVTHSDGWRQRNGYDRQSATIRWDWSISGTETLKTLLSYSHISQDSGGISGLSKSDFLNRPWYNYQTFDYRKVFALRASTEYENELDKNSTLDFIPFFRMNEMDLLPGWSIFQSGSSFYGYRSITSFYSLGLLSKYRHDFAWLNTRLVAGADIDYSPGHYWERRYAAFKTGDKFTSYSYLSSSTNSFDFDATFMGLSPYLQAEATPVQSMRLTLGSRFDYLGYNYKTYLSPSGSRPSDTVRDFAHLSPKAGLTYEFSKELNTFASYNHAFRVPSATDLFRGASNTASTSVNLKPIKADSFEVGARGNISKSFDYNLAGYYMIKTDDIVSYSPITNLTQVMNAGMTSHTGVEAEGGVVFLNDFKLAVSYSYAVHQFVNFAVSPSLNYNGKDIAIAPRSQLNCRLIYKPVFLNGGMMELQWIDMGSYWADNANTVSYGGYDILNFNMSYNISQTWEAYARAMNLTNTIYASYVSRSGSDPAQYSPGQPLTVIVGVTYHLGGM